MSRRDENIDQEARDLWRALRADPPPEGIGGPDLLAILIAQAPQLRYDRMTSPFLRDSQITRPRRPDA
jgi:hypothetical protein